MRLREIDHLFYIKSDRFIRYYTTTGGPFMARTWFGEIVPCCCLPPLLNLPAAFSKPRANHKGVPSIATSGVGVVGIQQILWPGKIGKGLLGTQG